MTDIKKRGIGDNLKADTEYKSLFENLISMVLEPKIDIDTFLKDQIERARTATRLADKFEALHHAEETRALYEDRLNTLDHFRQCANHYKRPYAYMWPKLESQWGSKIYEHYHGLNLKNNEYEFGTSWKTEVDNGQ